jgi:hypothetical protein
LRAWSDLSRSIKPTQIAGFNQLFYVGQGAELEQFGLGIDVKLSPTVSAGVEFSHEDLDVPWLIYVVEVEDFVVRYDVIEHELTHTYLY